MKRIAALCALATLLGLAVVEPAGAHPLGNFTINHYTGIVISRDAVHIDYVLDLAEIPTVQQREANEHPAADRCEDLAGGLELSVDGRRAALVVERARIAFLAGEGGLDTTRIECGYATPRESEISTGRLDFVDRNFESRIGWREITVTGSGVLVESDLPSRSVSERLTRYPDGAGRLDVGRVEVDYSVDGAIPEIDSTDPSRPADEPGPRLDALTSLIADGDASILALGAAIAVAAGLGAVHGLAPGHGKTVIGAFLVATRGTRRQALVLAVAVALSHTLGVFVLGAVTVAASAAFAPDRVYPYLQALSAAIIVALGAYLLWRGLALRRSRHAHDHDHHTHHDHDHHEHDHHDHDHHEHAHHEHHDAGHGFHRHGLLPHHHSRRLRDLDPAQGPLGWRALALLGLSGGLVPSTSAVVLLLGAVQLERLLLGGVLILAFGTGMSLALVTVGVGIATVSRRATGYFDARAMADRLTRAVQPVAGFAVLAVGLYLAGRAIESIGILS